MATALITGARGLLGSAICHLLPPDLTAVVVDRAEHDLLRPGAGTELVRSVRPDLVLHLAWCASGTPGYRTDADNERWVEATKELTIAARAAGAHCFVTGSAVDNGPPQDAYSAAKCRLRELLASDIAGETVTWLRPFYVVSPEAGRPQLVRLALEATRSGEPVTLQTPDSRHDFVHVFDVARGVIAAITHHLSGTVDIGSGQLRSVHALVSALGASWRANQLHSPDPLHHYLAAETTALTDVGWRPYATEELFGHG